jgi:predicted metalloprotease with PDZ domain
MKKNQSRRSLVIVLLLFIGIIAIGLTAAAVYAGRFMSQEVNSFLSQMTAVTSEPYAQESGSLEGDTIYEQGVLVSAVAPSSPAQQAGIRRGTIILTVDGQEVSSLAHIIDMLAAKGSGATVSITVLNGPIPEEIEVKLAEEPPLLGVQIAEANHQSGSGHFPGGFDLSEIPEDFRFNPDNMPFSPEDFGFGQDAVPNGVLVAEVVEGSAAEAAGLKVGDAIEAINGHNVAAVEQLVEQLGTLNPGDTIVLSIVRDSEKEDITVTLGEHPEEAGRGFLGIQPAPLMRGLGSMGGHGASRLPKEFFFELPPDFDPAELFEFPSDLENFLPNFEQGDDMPKLEERDA